MANGRKTPVGQPELRAAAPHQGGPLGSSGAAPETAPAVDTSDKTEAITRPVEARQSASEAPTKAIAPDKAAADRPEAKPDAEIKPDATAKADADSLPDAEAKTAALPKPGEAAQPDAGAKPEAEIKPDAAAKAGAGSLPGAGAKPDEPDAGAKPDAKPKVDPVPLRRAGPVGAVRKAGRNTSAWAKRPSGRLVLPGIIALLLLGAAGTAGIYLVPEALNAAAPTATPAFPGQATASGPLASLPTGSAPLGATGAPTGTIPPDQGQNGQVGQPGQRPADALNGWAQQVGTKVGIPVVAVQAYGYAELVVGKTMPACHLSWTTIAALAKVESAHGSANGAVLGADGSVQPPIYGLPLDGKGGRQLIRDTDQGAIDGDTTYDRAVGPLQFIPSTWNQYKMDADNNGVADPNDIDDASLTAAVYLCQGGRDLSKAESWWDAILSYNAVQPYAQKVFEAANDYGQRSR
ncbi:lytic murein transglycosylase [Paractinoplanes globisporus]|uniref:Lytic murein transglycosylase n=1 Tax=Paractinoplanes globisporus TaxID=113565 RepID=A0ABW6WRM9_9ACTN|nr:lytic murein transglycosylase [Actinoplanes globisporus]